ncbi:MAG: alpha-ketoglutarate-dependent dioxygenase AlkB [Rhodothermales bacterium]|nr:alpha-ketoglutarate-dependent dioxygenase AlkB [Rhodothermales bacterium]
MMPALSYRPDFLQQARADSLLESLLESIPWEQHSVRLFGKSVPCPRLSAWHGDPGARYAYSGTRHDPQPWTPDLLAVRDALTGVGPRPFNSVLLNRYRTGQDSMGWHADDEPELGPDPVIASVSLGARRKMRFRLKADHRQTHELWLDHGSLLIMREDCQRLWQHALPKSRKIAEERINLTYRLIL